MTSFKIRDEHWNILCAFMEDHKELAHGRLSGINGRERAKKLWGELGLLLNAVGFGERSPEKWQKTWTDLKYILKRKGSNLNKDLTGTGGGPGKETPFNKFELRLLAILGDSFYKGVGEPEIAHPSTCSCKDLSEKNEKIPFRQAPMGETYSKQNMPLNHDHDYAYPSTSKKRKVGLVEDTYTETVTILKEIKEVIDLRFGEIAKGIQDIKKSLK